MVSQNIKKKIAILNAKNEMNKFSFLEFFEYEMDGSVWVSQFEKTLKKFRSIDSTPLLNKEYGDSQSNNLKWIVDSLGYFKDKQELLILVPNILEPIWVNVKVISFEKSIEELLTISQTNEFTIGDKSTGRIAQLFCEEEGYEIHTEVSYVDVENY
ncbi:hypothetical protein [Metabacillus sp. 84]|uniref:hypothetical protein n=1 Tax=Metabacillus sp. 84 TaxID=3404705 RepID=UPI003CF95FC9